MREQISALARGTAWRSVARWGLLLAVAVGGFLRLYRIGDQGLWIDEAFSLWLARGRRASQPLARQPLADMVHWVSTVDQHPPLYYALLHGWMRIVGDAEGAVRALSALLGVLTIPVVYALGRRLADDRVGLAAALILALSPFHVRFAQETRMYTLLTLSVSLSLYAALCLFERRDGMPLFPGSGVSSESLDGPGGREERAPRWLALLPWGGYVIFSAVALWTHNAAVLFPLSLNLFVFGAALIERGRGPGRQRLWSPSWLRAWALAQATVLLLWLPWLPSFISQAVGVYRRFWLPAPTLGTVLSVVSVLLCDFLPLPLPAIVAVDVALIGLALLGLRYLRRSRQHGSLHGAFLWAVFLFPLIAEALVSLWRPVLHAPTLIWTSIPVILLVSAGLGEMRQHFSSRWVFLLALVAVLVVNGAGLTGYVTGFTKEEWDDAAALVAERAEPDDLILFHATWGQIPFDYYFRDRYNGPVAAHGVPVDLFDRGVLEPAMTEDDLPRLRALSRDRERVWLVYSHDWYTDPHGLVPAALEAEMALLRRWEFQGVQVFLYGR